MMNDFKMRRSDRELSMEETLKILNTADYGVLTTTGSDGFPYAVPVNFVYDGGKIYFHCAKNFGHKQKNIEFCSKICFTAVTQHTVLPQKFTTLFESAVVFGTAEKIELKKEFALELLVKKYCSDYVEQGKEEIKKLFDVTDIYMITPKKISGKANR